MNHTVKLFIRQWKVLLIAGALVAVLSLGVSLIAPLEYRADTEILILTRQQTGTDPLAVARAQELIAEQLATAVKTDAFFQQVVTGVDVPEEIVGRFQDENERKRRKKWHKAVDARAVFGTSVLTVSAFDTSREGAERLASRVATTLLQNGSEYVGTLVVARVVNEPIATPFPVRPNILLNSLLGFIVGVLGMGWMVASRSRGRII